MGRLEFCKYGGGGVNNVIFQAPGMSGTYSYNAGGCGVTATLTPPITIAAGTQVLISAQYDLTNTVKVVATSSGYNTQGCSPDISGSRYCFEFPTITPSASVV